MRSTPREDLQPTVQTIFLACGAFGGMIGTLIAAHLWNVDGIYGVGTVGSCCSFMLGVLVLVLWVLNRRKVEREEAMEEEERQEIENMSESGNQSQTRSGTQSVGFRAGKISSGSASEKRVNESSDGTHGRKFVAGAFSGDENVVDLVGVSVSDILWNDESSGSGGYGTVLGGMGNGDVAEVGIARVSWEDSSSFGFGS